jgi:hypothetical protein
MEDMKGSCKRKLTCKEKETQRQRIARLRAVHDAATPEQSETTVNTVAKYAEPNQGNPVSR